MIREAKTARPETRAAVYIRMSGRKQEKSPGEQSGEVAKLAAREGYRIVERYADEAITGDSTIDERPGLAALLAGARAGKFTVVLAWHTNRVSRQDPWDAIEFYNHLRRAGVTLVHTCQGGLIDLNDDTHQLRLSMDQRSNKNFLIGLAGNVTRGRIATAKAGAWGGAMPPYGTDRGEYDASRRLIRRLRKEERAGRGNQVRLLPCEDVAKLEAIRYAFHRFDAAHLSYHQLAEELQAKGYPPPHGNAWTRTHVISLLRNCDLCG